MVLIVAMLIGASPATWPTKPATRPTSKPADDLFTMPDDAFAKSPRMKAPIDFSNVDHEAMTAVVLRETNRHRVAAKLPKLAHLPKLDEAAKIHADDMNREKFFAHENPNDPSKHEPIDRVKKVGLDPRLVAENIATNFGIKYRSGVAVFHVPGGVSYQSDGPPIPPHTYLSFGKELVDTWMKSPHHKENIMLPDAKYLGAWCVEATPSEKKAEDDDSPDDPAFHKFYCVQVFFTPMRERAK
jgi:uncharacterized protein YkwD